MGRGEPWHRPGPLATRRRQTLTCACPPGEVSGRALDLPAAGDHSPRTIGRGDYGRWQSRSRASATSRRCGPRAGWRPRCSTTSPRTSSPASPPASSTRSATSTSSATAPTPRRSTTRASRARSAPRSTRSSATASPATRCCSAGDIVNIDITTTLDGCFGDCSDMFVVGGSTTPEASSCVDVTRESLWLGASPRSARPSGSATSARRSTSSPRPPRLRRRRGLLRPRHRPRVPHAAAGLARRQARQRPAHDKPGMTFTIEPMINIGTPHCDILAERLDRRHQGPQVARPGRAHHPRHRPRLRGPHPARRLLAAGLGSRQLMSRGT